MMNALRHSSILAFVALCLLLPVSGCKSKKKQMEAAAAEQAKLEREAELKRQQQEEERRRAEEEARKAEAERAKASAPQARLENYFQSIANSQSITAANSSISEALTLFASPDTPVLVIISETDGQKDYDRPTTIISYLNYLKDQKKNMNKVEKLQFDSAGKITEVELRKNF